MTVRTSRDVVLDAIRRVAPEADLSSLAADVDLRDELDLDSMDWQRIVAAIHNELGVDIPERDYAKLATLAGAEAYLNPPPRSSSSR